MLLQQRQGLPGPGVVADDVAQLDRGRHIAARDVGEHCREGVRIRVDIGQDGDAHGCAAVSHRQCQPRGPSAQP